jgi:hypothetical protein
MEGWRAGSKLEVRRQVLAAWSRRRPSLLPPLYLYPLIFFLEDIFVLITIKTDFV